MASSSHQKLNQLGKWTSLLVLCVLVGQAAAQLPEGDRVTKLDGYLDLKDFNMYSGYLPISPQQKIHYLFVTSIRDPIKDDVVLWLNGGPGCSSLLGFATELGPSIMSSGDTVFSKTVNPYSWNRQANLLVLEMPPGVGFSVNTDPNYVYNESRTASDTIAAIKLWFDRFPTFIKNRFWVTGESYCGMYIPNIVYHMLTDKVTIQGGGSINLAGMMIGNGVMVTNRHWRRKARNTFYSRHYYYGSDIDQLLSYCQYNDEDAASPACVLGNSLADRAVLYVNPYATEGICYTPPQQQSSKLSVKRRRRYYRTPFFQQNNPIIDPSLDVASSPCTDDMGITAYFNQMSVKQQLHVDTGIVWSSCNEMIGDTYHKDNTTIPYFQTFKTNGLKILLYTGNTDAIVSYVETEEYIREIGWQQNGDKKPFTNEHNSMMGWTTEYDGLTLAVINGAGHMVPADRPSAAYRMFTEFLARP